jgi:AraC-like DNA-binding protein
MKLKSNNSTINGVLHYQQSAMNYHLRRYFPEPELGDLVEQFWVVEWDLLGKKTHTQKNLPDPNFHLVFDGQKINIIGPSSKLYAYQMIEKGKLIGVKFAAASLDKILPLPISNYIDKEVDAASVLKFDESKLLSELYGLERDEQIIERICSYLTPFSFVASQQQRMAREWIEMIKNEPEIYNVSQLADRTNSSTRSIQRYCQQYLGLSPKWLIRRYRLHQALESLDKGACSILDLVARLNYTDQSHLIRDFKEMIGTTPARYSALGESRNQGS